MKTTKTHLSSDAVQTYGNENPGYYVMVVGGGAPTCLHPNRYAAEQEAKRLVNLIPGSTVHVMKVRSTYHNMIEPAFKEPTAAVSAKSEESAKRRADQREKQLARLEGLKRGDRVRISASHHLHAGAVGYIDKLGDLSDPTAYVLLFPEDCPPFVIRDESGAIRGGFGMMSEPIRFSPTSLTVEPETKEETPAPAETEDKNPSLSDILGACLGGLVKAALSRTQQTPPDEPSPASESSEENREAYEAARAIEPGVEVAVINDHHPFLPITTGFRGTKVRNDEDNIMFVFVNMTDETGATNEFKVNGSRIKRIDEFAGVMDETD